MKGKNQNDFPGLYCLCLRKAKVAKKTRNLLCFENTFFVTYNLVWLSRFYQPIKTNKKIIALTFFLLCNLNNTLLYCLQKLFSSNTLVGDAACLVI